MALTENDLFESPVYEDGTPSDLDNNLHVKMAMLTKIREWAGTNPLGIPITAFDWNDKTDIEAEIMGMMRHCGFKCAANSGIDLHSQPPEIFPTTGVYWSKQSSIPIMLDEKYFINKKNAPERGFLKACKRMITAKEEADEENVKEQSEIENDADNTLINSEGSDDNSDEVPDLTLKISDLLVNYW